MNSSDIAKLAGVSRSTVSRVVNNYSNVPEETRKKVLKVIKEYNYVPHASARILAGSKNKVIGLFIVDIVSRSYGLEKRMSKSPYYTEFTSLVIETASEMGYTVLVDIIHTTDEYERVKEHFFNKTISGGIFIGQNDDDEAIKKIISLGYKVVLVDQTIKEDDVYKKCIIVDADNYEGAYNATKYLIDLNHKKIAHITGGTAKFSSKDRVKGYKDALEKAGIPVDKNLIINSEFIEEGGYKAVNKMLKKKIDFTAIFASNDQIAFGAIKALKEANIRVPEDVSIIGFDDIQAAKYFNPPLTSMKMELVEMAELATKSVITAIDKDIMFSASYVIPVKLIKRESCIRNNRE